MLPDTNITADTPVHIVAATLNDLLPNAEDDLIMTDLVYQDRIEEIASVPRQSIEIRTIAFFGQRSLI